MKTLACGDLVPGCPQVFRAETADEILAEAGSHAQEAHGMTVTADLMQKIRDHIKIEGVAAPTAATDGSGVKPS